MNAEFLSLTFPPLTKDFYGASIQIDGTPRALVEPEEAKAVKTKLPGGSSFLAYGDGFGPFLTVGDDIQFLILLAVPIIPAILIEIFTKSRPCLPTINSHVTSHRKTGLHLTG